jgi:hypothetical protein
MLNSHTKIVSPPESGFLQWWHEKYGGWCEAWNCTEKVEEYIADLQTSRKIETWKLNFDELKLSIRESSPSTYGELVACVYLSYARLRDKAPRVIADKNNYYIFHLSTLAKVWPDAKFILLVRDGRDVACSYRAVADLRTESPYKPRLPVGIADIANEWKANNERILNFFAPMPSSVYYVLRYEDLVSATERELRRLCEFVGVEFEDSMLSYYVSNRRNQDEPEVTLDWKRMTLEAPNQAHVGKFRSELDQKEIDEFNSIASEILTKFRYF